MTWRRIVPGVALAACMRGGCANRPLPAPVRGHEVPRAALAPPASLRFSPRPNRAREIPWRPFGDAVFAEAAARHVPVVLSLAAVWCHWCHVLDETTLSDPRVIAILRDHAISVRVDADQHPDIERRYLLGGWPTVAFLDEQGRIITGGTYLTADRFLALFDRVTDAMAHPEALAALTDERDDRGDEGHPGALSPDLGVRIVHEIVSHGDPVHGGLEGSPKFPDGEAMALLAAHLGDDAGAAAALHGWVLGVSRLGDDVEGGFYRYATRVDWSVPHYEKMLGTNAEILEALARVAPDDPAVRTRMTGIVAWAHVTMRDAAGGWYAASQDADETYAALPTVAARAARGAPYVDRTALASLNARFASGLLVYARATGAASARDDALTALTFVREHLQRADGAMFHAWVGGEATLAGDLVDIAWSVRAFVEAWRTTQDPAWLDAADRALRFSDAHLAAPSGGYYDRPALDTGTQRPPGLLAHRWRSFELNVVMARALTAYGEARHDAARRGGARRTLEAFAGGWSGRGAHEAAFGRAVDAWQAAER